ncbi:hypothetical protein ACROYT_G044253 [Oculina patagonica]
MSSSRKSEEEIRSYSSEVLEDAKKRIKEAYDILNRETNRVRNEPETVDEAAKRLENMNKENKTRCRRPPFLDQFGNPEERSRFDTKPSEDGSYFIDRDGTHFRYILNYLRTGQLIVPEDKIVRKELLAEAEFYQVQGIINELTRKSPPRPFENSGILSLDQRKTLINWLKEAQALTYSSDNLLYRASRDGWNASNFHSCCDNKGPTVTVVKSTKKYIFGGFTKEWNGSQWYKKAPDSFLFSLVNPSGLPPTKLPLIADKEGYAIYCYDGFGPMFGGGCDLCIVSAPDSSFCSSSLNHTYQRPTGRNVTTFLAGLIKSFVSLKWKFLALRSWKIILRG